MECASINALVHSRSNDLGSTGLNQAEYRLCLRILVLVEKSVSKCQIGTVLGEIYLVREKSMGSELVKRKIGRVSINPRGRISTWNDLQIDQSNATHPWHHVVYQAMPELSVFGFSIQFDHGQTEI